MTGKEVGSAFRTCPSCGAVFEVSLADQPFCGSCGSLLVEEEPRSALPDWLQNEPDSGEPDELRAWLEAVSVPDRHEDAETARVEPDQSGGRPAERQERGASLGVVLGIGMFLAALCMLCWVLFAIVRVRAPDPASLLTVSRVVTVSANQSWQYSGLRVREGQVVSIDYLDGKWGIWGGPRAVEQLVSAAGVPGEYRSLGLPMASAPAGALIGRIGNGPPFHVGIHARFRTAERGRLELTTNDYWLSDNVGAVRVEVQVLTGQ
jgi:ribosomal protein S27AE